MLRVGGQCSEPEQAASEALHCAELFWWRSIVAGNSLPHYLSRIRLVALVQPERLRCSLVD